MHLWRIYNPDTPYAKAADFDPLDGKGAAVAPGRWNQLQTRLTYTSENLALAMLETLAHVPASAFGKRRAVEIELPKNIKIYDATPETLRWMYLAFDYQEDAKTRRSRLRQAEKRTQVFGSEWAARGREPVMKVPSAVNPVEFNYLLNPLHPLMAQVVRVRELDVVLDARFLRLQE
jgi:RES domain-containing protein